MTNNDVEQLLEEFQEYNDLLSEKLHNSSLLILLLVSHC